jgi:hypothetical protein
VMSDLETMAIEGIRAAQELVSARGMTLSEYFRTFNIEREPNPYRNLVKKALEPVFKTTSNFKVVSEQFDKTPVIQVADGASLLFDPTTLLNNLHAQYFAREFNLRFNLAQHCTTTKLIMDGKQEQGPAFLHLPEGTIKIFNASKSKQESTCPAHLVPAKTIFEWYKSDGFCQPRLPAVLERYQGQTFETAAEAIMTLNRTIWESFKMKAKKELVLFDEEVSRRVLLEHLVQGTDFSDLLFSPEKFKFTRDAKRKQTNKSFIWRDTTDFFYFIEYGRPAPIRIENGVAYTDSRKNSFDFSRETCIELLRDRKLYGDLFTTYATLVLLPEITALGGASQSQYLPEMCAALQELKEIKGVFEQSRLNPRHPLVGPSLTELPEEICRRVPVFDNKTDFNTFQKLYINMVTQGTKELQYLKRLQRERTHA